MQARTIGGTGFEVEERFWLIRTKHYESETSDALGGNSRVGRSRICPSVGSDVGKAAKDTGQTTEKAAKKTAHGTEKAADKTAHGTKKGVKSVSHGVKKGVKKTEGTVK
jgi:hypothetical protein